MLSRVKRLNRERGTDTIHTSPIVFSRPICSFHRKFYLWARKRYTISLKKRQYITCFETAVVELFFLQEYDDDDNNNDDDDNETQDITHVKRFRLLRFFLRRGRQRQEFSLFI